MCDARGFESNGAVFLFEENPQLWPLHGTQRFEEFQVGCESVIEENDVVISNLTLTLWESMGEIPPVSVRVLQIKTWLPESNLPPDISTLVSAIKFIQLWQNDSTNCVVIMTCLDGVSACGVFSAFLYIVDRMKSDKEIDIFQTVKCIRTNRTQFIVNLDQYKFLFDLTKTYLENIL